MPKKFGTIQKWTGTCYANRLVAERAFDLVWSEIRVLDLVGSWNPGFFTENVLMRCSPNQPLLNRPSTHYNASFQWLSMQIEVCALRFFDFKFNGSGEDLRIWVQFVTGVHAQLDWWLEIHGNLILVMYQVFSTKLRDPLFYFYSNLWHLDPGALEI